MCYAVNVNNLYYWYSDRKDTFGKKKKRKKKRNLVLDKTHGKP
jgi:hypothetical protein